jgi:hypothetical protein
MLSVPSPKGVRVKIEPNTREDTERNRNIRMMKAWGTYVPAGKLEKLNAQVVPTAPRATLVHTEPQRLTDVAVDGVNALGDTTYASANRLYSARVKETGDLDIAERHSRMHDELEHKKAAHKVKKRRNRITIRGSSSPKGKEEEEEGEQDEAVISPKHRPRRVAVPMPSAAQEEGAPVVRGVLSGLPVKTLEDQQCAGNQLELFNISVERSGRATSDIILNIPPPVKVLSYCRQFKNKECAWFYGINNMVADTEACVEYPNVPVLTREYLGTFMREADSKEPYERPCFNLTRAPYMGEGKIHCVAHRLSEAALGEGKGYRLRELLLPEQMTQINAAIEHNNNKTTVHPVDPREWLDRVPELCAMCHVYVANMEYTKQKDKEVERERMNSTASGAYDTGIVILNKFMVVPNRVGEYPLNKTLSGDANPLGIWGPFPVWSDRNYIPVMVGGGGLRGFLETDNLLFQGPQRSQQIGSSLRTPCSRSTPTPPSQQSTSFRQ